MLLIKKKDSSKEIKTLKTLTPKKQWAKLQNTLIELFFYLFIFRKRKRPSHFLLSPCAVGVISSLMGSTGTEGGREGEMFQSVLNRSLI